MRTVNAARYVTPLREGGSLPAIIEADDDGMYVLKFRGAGQGPKALIADRFTRAGAAIRQPRWNISSQRWSMPKALITEI